MRSQVVTLWVLLLAGAVLPVAADPGAAPPPVRKTVVGIAKDQFLVNGKLTYADRTHDAMKIEGLLLNARLVQGIFDDLNPQTRARWAYPDGPWDPQRNTREFLAAMPVWRRAGLLAFTIDLQGGNPRGYSPDQPWINSAFDNQGHLRPAYMQRLEQILDRADQLGMVVIVGYFYYCQAAHLADEPAVLTATDEATDWLLARGYRNVMVEVANESNIGGFQHKIFNADRIPELIRRVQDRSRGKVDCPPGACWCRTASPAGP